MFRNKCELKIGRNKLNVTECASIPSIRIENARCSVLWLEVDETAHVLEAAVITAVTVVIIVTVETDNYRVCHL